MWATFIFLGTTALFCGIGLVALWQLRWVKTLPSLAELASNEEDSQVAKPPIRCSVVVSARDEEARIEQTVRRLLGQRGVDARFIIVDDRSTDGTGEILQRLARDDARLQIKRIDLLPDGWLGKCHACHVGASAAVGDWILFTDADCWLRADVIWRAVRAAEREGVDHVTLTPSTVVASPFTRAWHLMFLTSILGWFAGVNRDRSKAHVGLGAFNLIRAETYRRSGGYEALRLTVLDDVKLGRLVRRAGKRTRAFFGVDDVVCHWGHTVRDMIKVMEKNYFAAVDFRVGVVVAGLLGAALTVGVVIAGLLSGTPAGLAAALSPWALSFPGAILARRMRWPWLAALLMPLMLVVFMYSLLNSTIVTLRQGGVRWRETFYPLAQLRAGMIR